MSSSTPIPPARRKGKKARRAEPQHDEAAEVVAEMAAVRTPMRDRIAAFADRAWRVSKPVAVWCARGLARVAVITGAAAWQRRRVLEALLARSVWWAALAAWAVTVIALWGVDAIDVERSLAVFTAGAVACVAVMALGRAGHLRWLGGALGSLHGVSAVLLWFIAKA